jgi:biopolymer transport protein ExbB
MEWIGHSIDYGIIGMLAAMSILAFAVAIERVFCYRATRVEQYESLKELELHLTRRLHLIASVGSNAPYVGLLGTVLGIMTTFASMGTRGLANAGAIMTGLALALKATAIGLLVAIPAVVLYNLLLRSAKERLLTWEIVHGRKRL